jgi:hypothetical protein
MKHIFKYVHKQQREMNLQKKFFGGQSEKKTIEFTGVNEIQKIYKNYIRIN